MAKVAFSKLKCKINDTEIPVQIGEETIMVKQYLPIQEKLGLISRVVELAHEQDYNFSNPVKADVFKDLEILFAYTNISFTDKQKEDLPKLYDMLISSGTLFEIIKNIPASEIDTITTGVFNSIQAVYQYQNSAMGILDGIKKGYNQTEFDVEQLQAAVQSLADTPFIKEILPLIGLE